MCSVIFFFSVSENSRLIVRRTTDGAKQLARVGQGRFISSDVKAVC
jgi:hypothetical protein